MKPFFLDKVSGSVGLTLVENEAIMSEDRKVAEISTTILLMQ